MDLKLLNVRQMYERGKVPVEAPGVPDPWVGTPPTLGWGWDPWNWPPDVDPFAKQQTIAFVHGWRMTYDESLQWADTTYKRLWQLGYKGRFYSFRWPTYGPDNHGTDLSDLSDKPGAFTYNASEYRAWLSGPALASFVNGLPNAEARYLIAHSMGNVVAGSALRSGMNVTRYAMCNSAMAAMAYNSSLFPDFPEYSTPDTDSDARTRLQFGLADKLTPVTTDIAVNFSLPLDSALGRWADNNKYFKPQTFMMNGGSYEYSPAKAAGKKLEYYSSDLSNIGPFPVTFLPEAMAYVIQSRTYAAGVRQDTIPSFVNMGASIGANVGFEFGKEHSAEWVYSIQKTYPFWKEVLKKFEVDVSNR